MENYKMMLKVLKEVEPKATAARGLAQLKGAKAEVSELLNDISKCLSDMAQCLDNYICAMSGTNKVLMDANVTIFELNKGFFNSYFNVLSAVLDSKGSLKGGETID